MKTSEATTGDDGAVSVAYNKNEVTTNDEWVNRDGEVIPAGKWYDKVLFTIGDTEITVGQTMGGAAAIIVLIIIAALACVYCTWRKREAIVDGARRMSTVVVRGASQIRKSLVGATRDD